MRSEFIIDTWVSLSSQDTLGARGWAFQPLASRPASPTTFFTGCSSAFWPRFLVSFLTWVARLAGQDLATSLLSVTRRLPAPLPTQPIKFPSTTGRSESLGRSTRFKSTSSRKQVPLPIPIILHYLGLTLTWVNWFTQWGGQGRVVVAQSRWDTAVSEMRTREETWKRQGSTKWFNLIIHVALHQWSTE